MDKNILVELEKSMKERRVKIPFLSALIGIPKDRMYKWYQQGTKVKLEDANKIWAWINGEIANKKLTPGLILEEDGVDYKTKYIELLEKTLQEKDKKIKILEENSGTQKTQSKNA